MEASKDDSSSSRRSDIICPSINIIGAGIAGLSLACHLRRRHINFNIFDAASKPKGHNYGISISPLYYNDLIPALEPRLTPQTFREAVAVDRLAGGHGIITPATQPTLSRWTQIHPNDLRASDSSLREVLAHGHKIDWNHKVVSAEVVAQGLKLNFENGHVSTANITIDAGGERSSLSSLLQLPEQKPEILPYAVYHGSRYIPQSTFDAKFSNLFPDGSNVRNFSPTSTSKSHSSQWHLQIAKAHVSRDHVSSKAELTLHSDTDTNTTSDNIDEPIVEFRYTLSRPSSSSSSSTTPDSLFNPNRDTHEAKTTPDAFFNEVSDYISDTNLPPALRTLLDPPKLKHDRILNWLLRLRPSRLDTNRLRALASSSVIAVGDAVHTTPPLESRGASLAMGDAAAVAEWIGNEVREGSSDWAVQVDREREILKFYDVKLEGWSEEVESVRGLMEELHGLGGKLTGRI